MERRAGFSRCGNYRYWLSRQWDHDLPSCSFVGLNPSTADALADDPTIRRIIGFARGWGYGSVIVVNLFAFKATYPKDLFAADNPVGPRNNYWLKRATKESDLVIAAWGVHGCHRRRDRYARRAMENLYCLGKTQAGHPRHPLYVRADTQPAPLLYD
jgi:hypothetical protein